MVTIGGGYLLGLRQGKAQFRHQKQAEILMEYNALVAKLSTALGQYSYSSSATLDLRKESLQSRRAVIDELTAVQNYLYKNEPWVEPDDYAAMEKVYKEAHEMQKRHTAALDEAKDSGADPETADEFRKWTMRDLVDMNNDIRERAEKHAGTWRKWNRHREKKRRQISS